MTPASVKREIERLTIECLKEGLAIANNSVAILQHRTEATVTWRSEGGYVLRDVVFSSLTEYLALVERSQYSFILFDGSLIQLSYTFSRTNLIKHRLGFYPCPFEFDLDDLSFQGILDSVELLEFGEFKERLRLRSPIRFDYDFNATTEIHPASHLHITNEECRIPVFAPLCIGKFISFVFQHFYPDKWRQHQFIRDWRFSRVDRCISEANRKRVYLDCVG